MKAPVEIARRWTALCHGQSVWGQFALACAGLLMICGLAQPAGAQTAPTPNTFVSRIVVEGNVRVQTSQIERWFAVRPGDRFDPRRVARATKTLTQKGRFVDVQVEGEATASGVVLYIVVKEYPQVETVTVLGSKKVKEDDLRAQLALGAKTFATPWAIRKDVDKLTAFYRDKGYFKAEISTELIPTQTPGAFVLQLTVQEGLKASVKQITFVGNNSIEEGELRKQMKTKKDGLFSGGDLKLDVLKQDFDAIARFYASEGFLDAQVLKHDIDLAENGKDLTLRIHVQEGQRFVVGDITWSGNTVFTDTQVKRQIELKTGRPFSEDLYESSTTALYELYQDKGYFYFNATPRRDVREDTVNLHYVIYEGAQARLGHIRVVGNTKTQDKVVLREFTLYPGDTFERSRLMRSMRDVFQLGFFDDVVPNVTPRAGAELVDVELRVAERQTGQLGAGAGYSAINGLTGFFEMAETNLFGAGKRLSFRWEFSRRRNDITFSFTQPWFLDTPTSVTTDLFNSSGRTRTNAFYNVKRTGGALRIGRRLRFLDYTTLFWRYRAERVTFTDFDSSIPQDEVDRLSSNTTRSSTGITLRRNSTDSPFFPTRGTTAEYSINLSGTFLGGTESYLSNVVELAWFQRVGRSKWAFMLRSRFGWLNALESRPAPNDELFRMGGVFFNGVRGYDEFEIVPVGNAAYVGGQAMSLFIAELRYPFSPRVHGALFFDAGDTWNSFSQADFSNLRKGAGMGIRVQMPMLGLLGLDYAYGFDRIDPLGFDRDSWNLHFRFGNLF